MEINAFEGLVCVVLLLYSIMRNVETGFSIYRVSILVIIEVSFSVGWSISHPVTEFTDINGHYLSLKVGAMSF